MSSLNLTSGILQARKWRGGAPVVGDGNSVSYDFSEVKGGASSNALVSGGLSSFTINSVEQFSGDLDFGSTVQIGSIDDSDNLPVNRTVPEIDVTGTDFEALQPHKHPLIVRNEAQTGDYSGLPTGSQAAWKYRIHFVRMGTRAHAASFQAAAKAAGFDVLLCMYFVINETQYYNSPFFKSGGSSGAKWSHEQFYDGLSLATTGGNPSTQSGPYGIFPGHFMPTVPQVTQNYMAALTGASDTKTVTVADVSGFKTNHMAIIWEPKSPGMTWANESRFDNGTPFKNAELVLVKSINTSTKTLTLKQARMGSNTSGDNSGTLLKTLAAGGGSVAHISGSHISAIVPGQGSNKAYNWLFNNSIDFCPVDQNGRTFIEFNAWWMNEYKTRSGSGGNTSIDFSLMAHDVTEDLGHGSWHFDINGDGVKDFTIVNGINHFRKSRDDSLGLLTSVIGLPTGGGGVKETFPVNAAFNQIENITPGQIFNNDEILTWYEFSPILYRMMKFSEQFATHPFLNAGLTKHLTKAFPHNGDSADGGTDATSNDGFHLKYAMSMLCGMPFAAINYTTDVDNWWEMWSVIADPSNIPQGYGLGDGISNLSSTQSLIRSNIGWLGEAIGRIKNMSGVDWSAMNKVAEWNFEDNSTSTQSFTVKSGSTTTLHKRSNEQYLSIENIHQDENYGNSNVQSPEALSTGDANKICIVKAKISSTKRNKIRVVQGNSATKRNLQETYIDEEPIEIIYRYQPNSDDVSSSLRRKIHIDEPRVEGNLRIHYIKVYVGTGSNYNPLVFGRDFENGLALANGNYSSVTIPLNGTYKVINMTSDQRLSWLTNGATVSGNITIPAHCGVVLYKPPVNTTAQDFETYVNTLPEALSVTRTGEVVTITVAQDTASTWGTVKMYPYDTDITPTIA